MAENTGIEWTDATWNPIAGCNIVSAGCTNCYAMHTAHRQQRMAAGAGRTSHYDGTTRMSGGRAVWTGKINVAPDHILTKPMSWRKPRMIFVNSMSDLFHESVPDHVIDRVFAVMALCPQHTFQVLTKRPERMREYMHKACGRIADAVQPLRTDKSVVGPLPHVEVGATWWPLPNVWLGTSVEDQQTADARIPYLLDTPAAVRFISAEPLLGPVDLQEWMVCPNARDGLFMDPTTGAFECCSECDYTGLLGGIDWIIVGGESGPAARPMHPEWARSIRDQCEAAGVAFLFKQWGEYAPEDAAPDFAAERGFSRRSYDILHLGTPQTGIVNMYHFGKKRAGRLLDGVLHDGYPKGSA